MSTNLVGNPGWVSAALAGTYEHGPPLNDLQEDQLLFGDTSRGELIQDLVLTFHTVLSADISVRSLHGICNPILREINFPIHA